jgi:urease accessory protein
MKYGHSALLCKGLAMPNPLYFTHTNPMSLILESFALETKPQGPVEVIALTWEERCKPRQRFFTEQGTEIAFSFPRGTIFRDGDVVHNSLERTIVIQAKEEAILVIQAEDTNQLCMVAHHLGNWHRSGQLLPNDILLAQADSPLEEWLKHRNIPYQVAQKPYHPNLRGTAHN